jgi:hypothetical protein
MHGEAPVVAAHVLFVFLGRRVGRWTWSGSLLEEPAVVGQTTVLRFDV